MKPLQILIAVLVVGFIASKCSSSTSTSSGTSETQAVSAGAQPAAATWHYASWEDKMTGSKGSYATLESENTANFEFPYQGEQHAELTVSDGAIVSLEVEKGQFSCTPGCYVLIKFDDEKADSYGFHASGDKWIRIASYDKKLWKKMFKAKRMTARAYFFQNGSVDFEFNIEGLKPFGKNSKTSKSTTA